VRNKKNSKKQRSGKAEKQAISREAGKAEKHGKQKSGEAERQRSRRAKKQGSQEAKKHKSKEAEKQENAEKLGSWEPENHKIPKRENKKMYIYIYIALQVFGGPALCLYSHAMTLNCHTDLPVRVNGIIPPT